MKRSKPMRVRQILGSSILDKRFRPFFASGRKVRPTKVHPLFVVRDLREGSLRSLDLYLAQNGGIPDREVALELRKLLSGSQHRSRYRLILIGHPQAPKSRGGRPPGRRVLASAKRRALAIEFERERQVQGKNYLASEKLVARRLASKASIARARKSVKEAEKAEKNRADAACSRESAMAKLRSERPPAK